MAEKKTLIYVIHSLKLGGVEAALLSAIPQLNERFNFKVIVLGQIDKTLIEHLSEKDKKVFVEQNYSLVTYPIKLFGIISMILKLKPDIVISSLWRSALVGLLLKKVNSRILFITFIHSTNFPHKLAQFFNYWGCKRSDFIFADSNSTKQFVEATFGLDIPIKTISFLTMNSPSERILRQIEADGFIRMIFVGRMNKVKNLTLSLKVIKELNRRGYNIEFHIYGRQDDDYNNVFEFVKKEEMEKYVHFKGELFVRDKISLFSSFHFLLQLSYYEGMAMSVVEAMQCSLPCIVTPVGEIPNYSQDMFSAIFFDNHNPDFTEEVDKIEKVILDNMLYQKISINCFNTFKNSKTYVESLICNIDEASYLYNNSDK